MLSPEFQPGIRLDLSPEQNFLPGPGEILIYILPSGQEQDAEKQEESVTTISTPRRNHPH